MSGDSCPCHCHREIGVLTPGRSLAVSRGEPLGGGGIARAPPLPASCHRPAPPVAGPRPCLRPTPLSQARAPIPGPPLLASRLAWRGVAVRVLRIPEGTRSDPSISSCFRFSALVLFVLQHIYLHDSKGKSIKMQLTLGPHGGWGAATRTVRGSRVTLSPDCPAVGPRYREGLVLGSPQCPSPSCDAT